MTYSVGNLQAVLPAVKVPAEFSYLAVEASNSRLVTITNKNTVEEMTVYTSVSCMRKLSGHYLNPLFSIFI